MKPSQQREAAKRVCEIRDATPESIARYLQPVQKAPARKPPYAVDSLDQFVAPRAPSRGGSATPAVGGSGSRPGTAGSIFADGTGKAGGRVASDSVWGFDTQQGGGPAAEQAAAAAPPSVFGGGKGGAPVARSSVFPDDGPWAADARAPAAPPTAGRRALGPPANAAGAAAEFAALGLGGLPSHKAAPAPYRPSFAPPPAAAPSYVAAMRALPAAGARSSGGGGAPIFRHR